MYRNNRYSIYVRRKSPRGRTNLVFRFLKILTLLAFLGICSAGALIFAQVITIDSLYKRAPLVPHSIKSLEFEVNGKETISCTPNNHCVFSPDDVLSITAVKTDGKITWGMRLHSDLMDVELLRSQPQPLVKLAPYLPFDNHVDIEISALWYRWKLGTIKIQAKWPAKHWIKQAQLTQSPERKKYFLQKALAEEPNHMIARMQLADLYFTQKDYKHAVQEYEKILRSGMSRHAIMRLLSCYRAMGQKQEAVNTYIRILKHFPKKENIEAFLKYLNTAYKPRQTKVVLEKCIKEVPDALKVNFWLYLSDLCTRLQDWNCVAKYSELASKVSSKNRPTLMYNTGVAYFQKGDYKRALKYFQEYVRSHPDDMDGLRILAITYSKLEEHGKAAALYEKLAKMDKTESSITAWISALRELGDREKLTKAYQFFVKNHPDNAQAWYNLGILEYRQKMLDEAERAFLKASKLDPQNPAPLSYLKKIYYAKKDIKKELGILEKLIALQPKELSYYEEFFQLTDKGKNSDNALTVLGKCKDSLPKEPKCYDMLLYILLSQGKKQEAAVVLEELVKLRPDDPQVLLELAKLDYDIGKYDKAVESLKKYLQAKPNDTKAKELYLQSRLKLLKKSQNK